MFACVRVWWWVLGGRGAVREEWASKNRSLRGAKERKCVTGERGSWRTTAEAAQHSSSDQAVETSMDISSSAPAMRNHRDINPRLRM